MHLPVQEVKGRGFGPGVRMIPWSRKWQPIPVLLPGKFHGQRSLVGYSPWGGKESDTTELAQRGTDKGRLRVCETPSAWCQRLEMIVLF